MPTEGVVVLVARDFPPRGGGGVMRMLKLAKYLPEYGFRVRVVAADGISPVPLDPTLLAELPPEVTVRRVLAPLRGARTSISSVGGRSVGRTRSRLWKLAKSAWNMSTAMSAVPDPDVVWAISAIPAIRAAARGARVVVSSGPPHSAHLAAFAAASGVGVPWIADLRDEWAGNGVTSHLVFPFSLADRRLEGLLLPHASAIVHVSEVSRSRYRARYPSITKRMHVIPNGYDPADVALGPPPSPPPVVITYAGSLGGGYRPASAVVRAVRALTEEDRLDKNTIRLRFVGTPPPTDDPDLAFLLGRGIVETTGFLPHREAIAAIAASHVAVVITNPDMESETALTGKVYEYLGLRVPILALTGQGALAQLVEATGGGVIADPRDPAAVTQALRGLVRQVRPARARNDVPTEAFDRRRLAGTWASLFRGLDSPGQGEP